MASISSFPSYKDYGLIPFANKLYIDLRNPSNRHSKDLVLVFQDLESEDAVVVKWAEDTIEFCVQNGFLDGLTPHNLALRSLPCLPDDAAAMKELILKQSESKHATIRQRALFACCYLTGSGYAEGFTTAASVASKKLRDSDLNIQLEGLQYFKELLTQSQPTLSHEDLLVAIKVASTLLVFERNDFFTQAYNFLEKLVGNGKEDDVLEIKDAIFETYKVDFWRTFNLCDKIAERFSDSQKLLSIPLEVAHAACASEYTDIRQSAVHLLKSVFLLAPEYGIEAFIQGILMESKRPDPCRNILSELQCFVNLDFPYSSKANKIVEKRWEKDSVLLLEALTHLSCCRSIDIRKQAAKLKQILENRLKNSESEK